MATGKESLPQSLDTIRNYLSGAEGEAKQGRLIMAHLMFTSESLNKLIGPSPPTSLENKEEEKAWINIYDTHDDLSKSIDHVERVWELYGLKRQFDDTLPEIVRALKDQWPCEELMTMMAARSAQVDSPTDF